MSEQEDVKKCGIHQEPLSGDRCFWCDVNKNEVVVALGAARLTRGAVDVILKALMDHRTVGLADAVDAAGGLGGTLYKEGASESISSVGGAFNYGIVVVQVPTNNREMHPVWIVHS